MGLFVDPSATVVLAFADDHPIADLRGESITVRESISDADWQELRASAMQAMIEGQEAHLAFSGTNGIRRMALWIDGVSFPSPRHGRYPRNMSDRVRWLGDLWPPAADAIRDVLDAHVNAMWGAAQPDAHPKPGSSSDQTTTEQP